MLNIICGSIPIQKGEVLIGGKDIAKRGIFRDIAPLGVSIRTLRQAPVQI